MELAERGLEQIEEQLQALYARLLDGDRTAPAQFAELVLNEYGTRGGLIRGLKEKAWINDLDEARDELLRILGLFIAQFLKEPLKYDPDKGPLGAYIDRAIKSDIMNEAQKVTRIKNREKTPGDDEAGVGEHVDRWNPQVSPEDEVIERELDLTKEQLRRAKDFLASLSPEEKECVRLMTEGIRDNSRYAQELGLTHLPVPVQRKTINNIKDRLKKRMDRLR